LAKDKLKHTAATFRRLLAKLVDLYVSRSQPQSTGAAAKAEASAARVEAQIKEICDLVSPGFGERFILLFRNQRRSRQDAIEYRDQRNLILVWLGEFAAAKRKRDIVEVGQLSAISRANRDRRMAQEFLREKGGPSTSESALKAEIGERYDLGRSAAIEAVNRGLKDLKKT
jgi:hypothetical protein